MGLKIDGAKAVLAAWVAAQVSYVSLHDAAPTEASPEEVAGTGYARVRVAAGGLSVAAAGEDVGGNNVIFASNAAAVTFPVPQAAWDDATHFAIWDAANAGNLLWSGTLTGNPDQPQIGSAVSFAAGALKFGLIYEA